MNASYETFTELNVEVEGLPFIGRYRVMYGTVIVYFGSEIMQSSGIRVIRTLRVFPCAPLMDSPDLHPIIYFGSAASAGCSVQ